MADDDFTLAWHRYAFEEIRRLVDQDQDTMSETELSIHTFASNALAGGDPTIAIFERGRDGDHIPCSFSCPARGDIIFAGDSRETRVHR